MIAQCNGGKTAQWVPQPRRLSQVESNSATKKFHFEDWNEDPDYSAFYFLTSLVELEGLKEGSVFTLELLKEQCQKLAEGSLEISYLDFDSNSEKVFRTQSLSLKTGQCKVNFSFKVNRMEDKGSE